MKYNRNEITELDPRQLIYVDLDKYSTHLCSLLINNKDGIERLEDAIQESVLPEERVILNTYPDREAYRIINKRGLAIIFKTNKNKNMYAWKLLRKLQ